METLFDPSPSSERWYGLNKFLFYRTLYLRKKARFRLPIPTQEFLVLLTVLGDTVVILSSFFCAFIEANKFGRLSIAVHEFLQSTFASYTILGTTLYLVIFSTTGGFKGPYFFSQIRVLQLIFRSSVLWLIAFLALVLALKLEPLSRYFFIWSFLNIWLLLSVWRLAFGHLLHESCWLDAFREKVLIVGWSKESDILSEKILKDPVHRYELIDCTPSAHGRFWVQPPPRIPILGDYNSLTEVLRDHKPNVVIMADLDPVMGEIIALANLCIREHVQFKVIPSYFQTFCSGLHIEHVSGIPVLGVSKLPLDYIFNRILKRAIDVVGAIIGLIISAPLILVFLILIRRESSGPGFYSQRRSGQKGTDFVMYKLRSMKLDADAYGLIRTSPNDPRRLKIGVFMRKWNIDELPQFWNVLIGNMSLVGPRPERIEDVHTLKDEIKYYNARHFSKPGLTGFAQVNGLRGNTDLKTRLRYDLYYLENWNIFF